MTKQKNSDLSQEIKIQNQNRNSVGLYSLPVNNTDYAQAVWDYSRKITSEPELGFNMIINSKSFTKYQANKLNELTSDYDRNRYIDELISLKNGKYSLKDAILAADINSYGSEEIENNNSYTFESTEYYNFIMEHDVKGVRG